MKRTERERIIEDIIMTDPFTSCDDDYQHFTLEECEVQLTETRKYNDDFNPEDRVPDDMTAAEVKKTWDRIVNEHWRKKNAFDAIRTYLLGEGNYDFPFNKYLESVKQKTGKIPHPRIIYKEYFFDEPTDAYGETLTHEQFALLVKNSPDFNPEDPFFWYEDGKLHSAKHIYPDIYDEDTVAEWCVNNNDDLDIDDTIHDILFKEFPQEVPQAVPQEGPHERNMGVICQFIEAFEDFLDEKGIVIPNDEKNEDPDASNIYGTDYGNLSDSIEELLRTYNVLEEED